MLPFRVGYGFDLHRLVEGKKLIICGVDVPHTKGCDAHSDGETWWQLLHRLSGSSMSTPCRRGLLGQHTSHWLTNQLTTWLCCALGVPCERGTGVYAESWACLLQPPWPVCHSLQGQGCLSQPVCPSLCAAPCAWGGS